MATPTTDTHRVQKSVGSRSVQPGGAGRITRVTCASDATSLRSAVLRVSPRAERRPGARGRGRTPTANPGAREPARPVTSRPEGGQPDFFRLPIGCQQSDPPRSWDAPGLSSRTRPVEPNWARPVAGLKSRNGRLGRMRREGMVHDSSGRPGALYSGDLKPCAVDFILLFGAARQRPPSAPWPVLSRVLQEKPSGPFLLVRPYSLEASPYLSPHIHHGLQACLPQEILVLFKC